MQVKTQAAQVAGLLSACQSIQTKYAEIEGWAHTVNGWVKKLEENAQKSD
jgi:hypothetical protein